MVEHRAKKVVRKSYANCGHEPVIPRDRATGPPGAASHRLGTAFKGGNTLVWNKRSDEPATYRPQDEPMRSPAPVPMAAPAAAAPAGRTSGPRQPAPIAPSMTIKGEIRAGEELLVDGEVEGTLESQSLLTVGPNGKVRGNIKRSEERGVGKECRSRWSPY